MYIPNVETHRGTSPKRDGFYVADFIQYIYIPYIYIIYNLYLPNQQLPLPHFPPVTHRVTPPKCHAFSP